MLARITGLIEEEDDEMNGSLVGSEKDG